VICPGCGQALAEAFRFCPFCGAALAEPATPSREEEAEARIHAVRYLTAAGREDVERQHPVHGGVEIGAGAHEVAAPSGRTVHRCAVRRACNPD